MRDKEVNSKGMNPLSDFLHLHVNFWVRRELAGIPDNPIKNGNCHTLSIPYPFPCFIFYIALITPPSSPCHVPFQLEHKLHEGRVLVCIASSVFPLPRIMGTWSEALNSGPRFVVAAKGRS